MRPRIRSIKPEMWTDEDFGMLDPEAQVLFIGLISHADDEGRFKGTAARVRALIWPFRGDLAIDRVDSRLVELADAGMIVLYENAGRAFIELPNWSQHQRVDKPTKSQYPSAADEDSRIAREASRKLLLDRIGRDRKGSEGTGPSVAASGDVDAIWQAYVDTRHEVLGASSTPTLTAPRRKLITSRLKDYPAADLVDAVKGWRHSPHNRGENDRGRPFCDLELLLRDAGHIETFRDMERSKSQPAGATVADLAARINAAHESEAAA